MTTENREKEFLVKIVDFLKDPSKFLDHAIEEKEQQEFAEIKSMVIQAIIKLIEADAKDHEVQLKESTKSALEDWKDKILEELKLESSPKPQDNSLEEELAREETKTKSFLVHAMVEVLEDIAKHVIEKEAGEFKDKILREFSQKEVIKKFLKKVNCTNAETTPSSILNNFVKTLKLEANKFRENSKKEEISNGHYEGLYIYRDKKQTSATNHQSESKGIFSKIIPFFERNLTEILKKIKNSRGYSKETAYSFSSDSNSNIKRLFSFFRTVDESTPTSFYEGNTDDSHLIGKSGQIGKKPS